MVFARLFPGQNTIDAARHLAQRATDERDRRLMTSIAVVPLKDVFGTPESRTIVIRELGTLKVVGGLASLVLLGGCATLAALVLVHYERRRRELAVRIALGASRLRLALTLIRELSALIVGGAVGAILVTIWGVQNASGVDCTRPR